MVVTEITEVGSLSTVRYRQVTPTHGQRIRYDLQPIAIPTIEVKAERTKKKEKNKKSLLQEVSIVDKLLDIHVVELNCSPCNF